MVSKDRSVADYDLVIVGSGVIGLLHAWMANRAGKRVAVIEKAAGISGASIRNFGHIGLTAQSGKALEYGRRSRQLWLELAEEAGFWICTKGATVAARSHAELNLLEQFAKSRPGEDVLLLGRTQVLERTPVRDDRLLGGAWFPLDLQVDSREALKAVADYLARSGVEFFWQTKVQSVATEKVTTNRGEFITDQLVVAVNYEIDQFFPELAEELDLKRCSLQMLAIAPQFSTPLETPLLTGWSLLRYSAFKEFSAYGQLQNELWTGQAKLHEIDLNQMYAQRPNGELIVGDSHVLADDPEVFQSEQTYRLLLEVTKELFGFGEVNVVNRWQGVYASAPGEFLIREVKEKVWVVSVTTGIGMSTGPGLVEDVINRMGITVDSPATAA